MRGRIIAALFVTLLLTAAAQILAQTETSPTDTDERAPEGAADDGGVFSPVWMVLVAVGFVVFVMAGLLWRKRQRPGAR